MMRKRKQWGSRVSELRVSGWSIGTLKQDVTVWPSFCSSSPPHQLQCRLRNTLPLSWPFSWRPDYAPTQGPACFSPFCPCLRFWSVSLTVLWFHGLPCFPSNLLVMFLSEPLHWLSSMPLCLVYSVPDVYIVDMLPHHIQVTHQMSPSQRGLLWPLKLKKFPCHLLLLTLLCFSARATRQYILHASNCSLPPCPECKICEGREFDSFVRFYFTPLGSA